MTSDLLMSWSSSLIIAGLAIIVWAGASFCVLWAVLAALEAIADTVDHVRTKLNRR